VVAVGGNAILPPEDDKPGAQRARINSLCRGLKSVLDKDYEMVVTHGNGPHVGNILIQNELARRKVPSMPLDVCVAQTQAQIGYELQQGLSNILKRHRISKEVVTVVTQVVVNPRDKAFKNPTKPIGPYYSKTRAKELMRKCKWKMVLDPRGGFRRLVPSPRPLDIVEKEVVMDVLRVKDVAIAVGGGGIPVIKTKSGLRGIEGVIDKDLASSLLARIIGVELFVIVTDVERVALHFNTPRQRELEEITLKDAKKFLRQGHFPPGSMGPKIEAAIEFLDAQGAKSNRKVIVTSIDSLPKALAGKKGTIIKV
jgi:carbamate kinase